MSCLNDESCTSILKKCSACACGRSTNTDPVLELIVEPKGALAISRSCDTHM